MTDVARDPQLATDREIDRVVHDFEQALRRGETPRIEELAVQHASLGQPLARELLMTEIEFRRFQRQSIDWNAYAARFPEAADELRSLQGANAPAGIGDTSPSAAHDSVAGVTLPPAGESGEAALLAPLDLSDYVLETRLGRGGQGEVYLARQRSLGRLVAVKLLHKNSASDSLLEQRFLREARTLAQTHHPQIVTIHGIGRSPQGELFLVMEYIEGQDLARQIAAKTFAVRDAVQVVVRIAGAIEHAHARGVIHRDLKPSNVLWDDVRGPVVTDFGLAKDLRAVDALTVTDQLSARRPTWRRNRATGDLGTLVSKPTSTACQPRYSRC